MKRIIALSTLLTVVSMPCAAWANNPDMRSPGHLPPRQTLQDTPLPNHWMWAQADAFPAQTPMQRALDPTPDGAPPAPRLTPNKIHQYLGIAALVAGAVTAATFSLAEDPPPPVPGAENEAEGGFHEVLADVTVALAASAVATGFAYHHEDVGLGKPLNDPDNLHMMLTLLGSAGFFAATALEGDSGHSIYGGVGGAAMLMGIKIAW